MDAYLGPYQLTQAGNPLLIDDEVILQHESNLSIYFGDTKKFRKGKCVLTTYRILWTDGKSIRHSLHLKHIKKAKTKSGFVGMSSPKIILDLNDREVVQRTNNNQNYSNLQQPKLIKIAPPKPGYIMLSFHTSTRDDFLKKMLKAMQTKSWIKAQQHEEKRNFTTKAAGIRGLMEENKRKQARQKKIVSEAFEDLESLMVHAKQMVALANKLSASSEAKEQANEFDNMLQGMGIISPVTKQTAGSEYHQLLARQLVDFLLKPLKRCGGMMTLTDIYCFYNKARGTQLVSPDDLKQSCHLMRALNLPMTLKKFDTGVMVLQLNEFNEENQTKRILDLIQNKCENKGIDELRLSQLLNISINLAREQLLSAEKNDFLCRDDSGEGLKFYKNIFSDYKSKKRMYWANIRQLNLNINDQRYKPRPQQQQQPQPQPQQQQQQKQQPPPQQKQYQKKQKVVMDL